jgi:hypothetical protein
MLMLVLLVLLLLLSMVANVNPHRSQPILKERVTVPLLLLLEHRVKVNRVLSNLILELTLKRLLLLLRC